MAQTDKSEQHAKPSTGNLGFLLSERELEGKLMQERWRIWKQMQVDERERTLDILKKTAQGVDEEALKTLRSTTSMRHLLIPERWRLQDITHLEALVYGIYDAQVALDSHLWQGTLAPESMRLATKDEANHYCPDSTNVNAVPEPARKGSKDVRLENGDRLVAEDKESQAMLNFISHYVEPNEDAPNALIDFHRDLRLRENYHERTEHALEASFTMYGIAKDFAAILVRAEKTDDHAVKAELTGQAEELLMEFNLQRYGLLALLKTSHWNHAPRYADEDKEFVQSLSRDMLIHALAEQSYELPTKQQLQGQDYQEREATVESYFAAAYQHMEHVLGIRPHRDRVMDVPPVDEVELDRPQGRLH